MKFIFVDESWEDYLYWQKTDKKKLNRINELLKDISRSPFQGIGKPEPLKYKYSGFWSRRIDDEHRLIYQVKDDEILIESFLDGMEVSVGVIDYKGETIVLGITEIVPQNEFFDYEAKYEGASEEITPARIDDETRIRVEEIAKRAYNSLGMSGFSRSEFILMDGIPYMLEMNTNPGFSPASILPQQAKIYGISITDLCGNEVEKALNKFRISN